MKREKIIEAAVRCWLNAFGIHKPALRPFSNEQIAGAVQRIDLEYINESFRRIAYRHGVSA